MEKFRILLIYVSFGLSFSVSRGQQIVNYVTNGSFENLYTCSVTPLSNRLEGWSCVDSTTICCDVMHACWGNMPHNVAGYQYAKEGVAYPRLTFYCPTCMGDFTRSNLKNRLKKTLVSGKTYCVKMFVSLTDKSPQAIDGLSIFFGDASVDTIIANARQPLTFLNPQISNSIGNFISDSMNWVPITGTFTANGTEKYLIINNFKSNIGTNTVLTGYSQTTGWADYYVDAVSCIELNLPAFAGMDTSIHAGDSVFIGRKGEWAQDPSCIWYKLPDMTTALDTASGLWVKPMATSTYVVRQELDCSVVKWDTVVVAVNVDDTGIKKLRSLADRILLIPNPTSGDLKISLSGDLPVDLHTASISNSMGQTVEFQYIESKASTEVISTSQLPVGLYQIHLRTSFGTISKKFVKTD